MSKKILVEIEKYGAKRKEIKQTREKKKI